MTAPDLRSRILCEAERSIPHNDEGPLFPQAWHARVFALIVALTEGGHLDWKVFQTQLVAHLREGGASADGQSDAEINRHYFDCWLEAAEEALTSMGFVECDDLVQQIERIRDSVARMRSAQLLTINNNVSPFDAYITALENEPAAVASARTSGGARGERDKLRPPT